MATLSSVLAFFGFGLLAVAGFTYHDGHDHNSWARAEAVVGFVSLAVFMVMKDSALVAQNYDCTVGTGEFELQSDGQWEVNRPECPSLSLREFFLPYLIEILQGFVLGLAALTVGWLAAKLTPRQPSEARPFFPDED